MSSYYPAFLLPSLSFFLVSMRNNARCNNRPEQRSCRSLRPCDAAAITRIPSPFSLFFPLLSRSAVPLSQYPREDAHAETCTARLSHAHRRARLSARRIRCYLHGGLKETERLGSGDWPPNCRALLRHYGVVSSCFFLPCHFLAI